MILFWLNNNLDNSVSVMVVTAIITNQCYQQQKQIIPRVVESVFAFLVRSMTGL